MNAPSGQYRECAIPGNAPFASAQMTRSLPSGNNIRRNLSKQTIICSVMLSRAPKKTAHKAWMSCALRKKMIAKPFMST